MLPLLISPDEDDGSPTAIRVGKGFSANACFSLKGFGDVSSKPPGKQEENAANRKAFFDLMGLNIRKQVRMTPQHRSGVKQVWPNHDAGAEIKCDAIFTTDRSLVLTILAADAFPTVVTNRSGSFLLLINGSIWSVDQDVVKTALQQVRSKLSIEPAQFEVVLGPGICPRCYISKAHERFKNTEAWAPCITDDHHIDLRQFIINRFSEEGVPQEQIYDLGLCTWHHKLEGSGYSFPSDLRSSRTGEEEGRFIFACTLTNNRAVPS